MVDVAAGDIDGDGHNDLVIARDNSGIGVMIGDRHGSYREDTAGRFAVPLDGAWGVELADVDGDGDLDLAVAREHDTCRMLLNQGIGVFTDVTATNLPPVPSDHARDFMAFDADGDGDLDLLFNNRLGLRLLRNSGRGVFTDVTAQSLPQVWGEWRQFIAAVDLDGDGDLDLVRSLALAADCVLLNSGTGVFRAAPAGFLPPLTGQAMAIAAGDLNADGISDLLFSTSRLLLSVRGTGFVDVSATHLPPFTAPGQCAFVDVDRDGDRDLIAPALLYLNDGSGVFTDVTVSRMSVQDRASFLVCADADGDGDIDAHFVPDSWFRPSRILINHDQQLGASTEPHIGTPYRIDADMQPGYAPAQQVAFPHLGFAATNTPVPGLGRLGVAPWSLLGSARVVVPAPTGRGSVAIPVPSTRSLVGVELRIQALMLDVAMRPRLSNTLRAVIH